MNLQLTYDLPKGMEHDQAVAVFGVAGVTNLLLGVGIRGRLAVQMTDASAKDVAEVQIAASSAGLKLAQVIEC
jgi:hypothetical protein